MYKGVEHRFEQLITLHKEHEIKNDDFDEDVSIDHDGEEIINGNPRHPVGRLQGNTWESRVN